MHVFEGFSVEESIIEVECVEGMHLKVVVS